MIAVAKKKSIRREDRPGHLDPKHAASLRALGGETNSTDDNHAFVGMHPHEELAHELGEEAVLAMTSGEDGLADDRAADRDEEIGGPFMITSADTEFADGTDLSNPARATKEPFPTT